MPKLQFTFSLPGLFLVPWLALSCGAVSAVNQGPANPGQLQAITLNPAMADSQDYPHGQVPFVATGVYLNPAHEVVPLPALWGACQKNAPTIEVSVTNAGVAQWVTGASGAYTVFAFESTNCNVINACGGGCTVVGTAQSTCP